MLEKIKQFIESEQGKDIFVVLIVILVGLSSFGLGRLSKKTSNDGLRIEYPSPTVSGASVILGNEQNNTLNTSNSRNIPVVSNHVGKAYFASKRGQKYYSIGCSAGKTIKQENRVYFSTKDDAEKAGFELSSACK
ncbi:MAG: hypothetical protein NTW98_00300 [Candidatus Nomurabacteria bacterium]|nr:hypothetical protein [Candidatus Nomurabacteria bacterium]